MSLTLSETAMSNTEKLIFNLDNSDKDICKHEIAQGQSLNRFFFNL